MSWYRYRAKTLQGKYSSGRLGTESDSRAYEAIREQGLSVVQLKQVSEKHITKPLGPGVLAELSGQLAVTLESGIPLLQGMNILLQKERDGRTACVFKDVYQLLLRGHALSEAMSLLNGVFPPMIINMVKAGETGGDSTEVMRELLTYYDKNHRMKKRVVSTLTYPAFLLLVMIVVMIVLSTTVLPEFFTLFDPMETLPISTRVLMSVSSFVTTNGFVSVFGLAFLVAAGISLTQNETVRCHVGKLPLRIPVVGKLLMAVYTTRFARAMSALYTQGVSMIQVLCLSIDMVGNRYAESQLKEVVQEICEGTALPAGIARVNGLDRRFSADIYVGEETGEMNVLLLRMAECLETDAEKAAERFTALIEPVLIVIMGLVVAAMMMAVMLSMMQYYQGTGQWTEEDGMKLTVNLAEDAIITLRGKVGRKLVIQDCERYPLPQGALINDVVTDEEQFLQVLQTIKARYGLCVSRVHLVLGSNQIVTKVTQVPKMTEKQMRYLVRMELEHYRAEEKEMIYDYSITREGNDEDGTTVLGTAIERGRMELYENLFARCGTKIVSVDIVLSTLLHLVERIPQLKDGTYLLSVLDGRNMITVLYTDGIYRHTARNRSLHERGSIELLRKAMKEITAMASFAKSLENGTEVRTLYVGGMNREEQSTLFDMLDSELGIVEGPVKEDGLFITKRKPEFCLADYVYAAGSLLGRQV